MEREILVSADARETRVALLEEGVVVEAAIDRHADRSHVGNVYKARVSRVLPGMQSAFLDVGLERDAFLHVTDFAPGDGSGWMGRRRDAAIGLDSISTGEAPVSPPIEELIREGDTLLVQVVKEAIVGKGSRVTSAVALPGRYLVLLPLSRHIGVSRKITDAAERERLKSAMIALIGDTAGCIVRTAAEGNNEADLRADLEYLRSMWRSMCEVAAAATAPTLLHTEIERPLQLLRDLFGGSVVRVVVEGEEIHHRILDFVAAIAPRCTDRVSLYTDPEPLLAATGVQREIERALRNKVWLKSGGSIVINQTEALVSVDVNTGKYTGRRSLEETILKINLEAMKEIVRQLRLRDLGGIIVIDFIDMEAAGSRETLFRSLETELRRDRARTQLHELSDFGLVQITRKRARRSLERTLCRPCPTCRGAGRVKTATTVVSDILMKIRSTLAIASRPSIEVHAHPEVVALIEAERPSFIASLGVHRTCNVIVHADPSLSVEGYAVETP